MVTLSMLTATVFADITTDEFNKQLDDMIKVIQENYYKDITVEQLKDGALKGMFNALDKHSEYFSPSEYADFTTSLSGNVVGIGVLVEKNAEGGIKVITPYEGSSAIEAGVKAGDIIIKVDDVDITDYALDKAVSLIRGVEGTKVKITIIRPGSTRKLEFTLVRKPVTVNPVTADILEDGIGYIRISQFNGNVLNGVNEALELMDAKKVKGIIFDLRGNPGGYLNEVIAICQELIPAGPVVHIQQKGVITETYSSTLNSAPYKLVALVDNGSASASEIMAGAIKDSGAGILVGEKTYGKGTVQTVQSAVSGAGYKITIANYLTPSKFSLDGIGITPDVVVDYDLEKTLSEFSPMSLKKTLKKGKVSLDVQGMQQRLAYLGIKVDTDGVYDGDTKTAVLKFQKANKLSPDGVMNTNDLEKLEFEFEKKLATGDPQLKRALKELKKLMKLMK